MLREQLGKRPRLNDDQRRRLAALRKQFGRKLLSEWAVERVVSVRPVPKPMPHDEPHGIRPTEQSEG